MRYEYMHFIPQNIAPKGAKKIGVYGENGKRVLGVPLGRLTPSIKEPIYSFGLVSDTHLQPLSYSVHASRFETAMTWFETQGAAFVCHTGDITNHGFANSDGSTDLAQFADFKRICDLHPDLPVYAVCGNHDSFFTPITNNLTELEAYTGHGLYYSIEHEKDLFIFAGQPSSSSPMSDEALSWLEALLKNNGDKRCFVFIHPYISGDSGNTLNAYGNALLPSTSAVTQRLIKALSAHGNAILFHGHTHFMPSMQVLDETTNYTDINDFPSVHVPSVAAPAFVNANGSREQTLEESYGYIVDVYDDCIVLNGLDFVSVKPVPLGVYKIDTALQTVEADTFTDDTGIIVT